jgi:hypothetical protein
MRAKRGWLVLRHDLVGVPVIDAPATTLLLAWPETARSQALAAFVQAASDTAALQPAAGFRAPPAPIQLRPAHAG